MAGPDLAAADFVDVRFVFGFVAAFFLPALGFFAEVRFDVFLAVFFFPEVLAVRLRAAAFFFALRAGTAFLAFLVFLVPDFVFFAMADPFNWASNQDANGRAITRPNALNS